MKKFLSLLLAALMLVSMLAVFASCGDKGGAKETASEKQEAEENDEEDEADEEDEDYEGDEGKAVDIGGFQSGGGDYEIHDLTAEKIGTIPYTHTTVDGQQKSLYYKDGDRYGIITYDGKKDTGAVFAYVRNKDIYYEVITEIPDETADEVTAMNASSFADSEGNIVTEKKYAGFRTLSKRYIQAITVTGTTDSEKEAIMYSTDRMVAFSPEEGDKLYAGYWEIFDMTTGKMVEGVKESNSYVVLTMGEYIKYNDDETGKQITVGPDGKEVDNISSILDDNFSVEKGEKEYTVCDILGNKVFSYDPEEFTVSSYVADGYFRAYKYDSENSRTVNFLVDSEGKEASPYFDDSFEVYGKCIFSDGRVYDFEGKEVIEGEWKSLAVNKLTYTEYMALNDDSAVLFDITGRIILSETDPEAKGITFDEYQFNVYKTIDSDHMYYSVKDNDYTVKGISFAPFTIKSTDEDYHYSLIDLRTGKAIIEDCDDMSRSSLSDGGGVYVFAKNDDSSDIYLVK